MVNYQNNLLSTRTCPVTSTEVHLPPGSEKGGQDFHVSDISLSRLRPGSQEEWTSDLQDVQSFAIDV